MNENNYTFQTITLDVAATGVVFTEDGRAFYDMQAMVDLLSNDVANYIVTLEDNGVLNDATDFVTGQITIIERIQEQADGFVASYKMQEALSAVSSVEDMFTS